MGYEWYTNDVSNVARGKLAEYHTSWKFTARKAWSYFDLYDKKLCLEVWDKETLLPNEFIARASMPMIQLATNEMAMQVPVLRNEKIKKRMVEIDVGYVSFTMVFQEVCEYPQLCQLDRAPTPKVLAQRDQIAKQSFRRDIFEVTRAHQLHHAKTNSPVPP